MTGGELRLLTEGRGILTAEIAEDTEKEWNRGDNSLKAVRRCGNCANSKYGKRYLSKSPRSIEK
jgi:hypothetical protein